MPFTAHGKAHCRGSISGCLWTPECNSCCPEMCPAPAVKHFSTGFGRLPRLFLFYEPGRALFPGVVKCLFARPSGVSLRQGCSWNCPRVRTRGGCTQHAQWRHTPAACAGGSCPIVRPAQSKRQPTKMHSIFLLNLQLFQPAPATKKGRLSPTLCTLTLTLRYFGWRDLDQAARCRFWLAAIIPPVTVSNCGAMPSAASRTDAARR